MLGWIWVWVVVGLVSLPTVLHLCHRSQLFCFAQERGGASFSCLQGLTSDIANILSVGLASP